MSEHILDVLMYLIENYVFDDPKNFQDQAAVTAALSKAGFRQEEISEAFEWITKLSEESEEQDFDALSKSIGIRQYMPHEITKLGADACGLLIFLENVGFLDPLNREAIVDFAMSFDNDELDFDRLKWIIMTVLSDKANQNPLLLLNPMKIKKSELH